MPVVHARICPGIDRLFDIIIALQRGSYASQTALSQLLVVSHPYPRYLRPSAQSYSVQKEIIKNIVKSTGRKVIEANRSLQQKNWVDMQEK